MTDYNQESNKNKNKALNELSEKIKICVKCNLCNDRINAVPGEGSYDTKLFFIGEAPGKNEDLTGKPFCGAAGKNLDIGLKEAELQREDVFITSVVKCRPPNNRNPKPEELEACKPFIDEQLRLINPKIIVLMGNFGLRHFFPQKNITQMRGQLMEKDGKYYYPILHPAAVIYRRSNMDLYLSDFRKLREIIDTKFK